jgi:hypothetical protein
MKSIFTFNVCPEHAKMTFPNSLFNRFEVEKNQLGYPDWFCQWKRSFSYTLFQISLDLFKGAQDSIWQKYELSFVFPLVQVILETYKFILDYESVLKVTKYFFISYYITDTTPETVAKFVIYLNSLPPLT